MIALFFTKLPMNYEQSFDAGVSDDAAGEQYLLPKREAETPSAKTSAVCESKERIGRTFGRYLLQRHREYGVRY